MNAPLFISDSAPVLTAFLMLLTGVGFGYVLSRAGFASAKKLASQFYLKDMAVFKVMFTAIITTMSGLFALAALGVMDLGLVAIHPTHAGPQLVGGLLLGLGFIISGYCPGTCFLAAASGRLDGMVTIAGIIGGSLVFGLLWTEPATGMAGERMLLSEVLGVNPPFLVLCVIAAATGCFLIAEEIERRNNKAPVAAPLFSRPRTAGLVVLLIVTVLIPIGMEASGREGRLPAISPLELAEAGINGANFRFIDLRPITAVKQGTFSGALHMTSAQSSDPWFWRTHVPADLPLVLVTDSASPVVAVPEQYTMYWLEGGWTAWKNQVLTRPAGYETSALAERRRQAYRYATGKPLHSPAASPVQNPCAHKADQ